MLRQQILIFLLFLPLLCFAQVIVDKSIFEGVNRSIILISKEDGYTVFEDTLTHEGDIRNYTHSIKRTNENEWLNLTIINIIDTLYEFPIKMTCSYLDIQDDFFIDNKSDFLFEEPTPRTGVSKIRIHGIESLQQCHLPEQEMASFKLSRKSGILKIKTKLPYGENLYVPILANDEESYRYLFIPYPLPHNLNVEWDNLEKAVINQKLSLPKGAEKLEVKALLDVYEGETTVIKQEKINGVINLIVPLDMELYDFRIAYNLGEARKKFDLSNIQREIKKKPSKCEIIEFKNHGFELSFNQDDENFVFDIRFINARYPNCDTVDKSTGKKIRNRSIINAKIEHWVILGKTSDYVKFEFPKNKNYTQEDFIDDFRPIATSQLYILDKDGESFYWSISPLSNQ